MLTVSKKTKKVEWRVTGYTPLKNPPPYNPKGVQWMPWAQTYTDEKKMRDRVKYLKKLYAKGQDPVTIVVSKSVEEWTDYENIVLGSKE